MIEKKVNTMFNSIQYISDKKGTPTAVVVPIKLWKKIESEGETKYLLKSPAMKKRLLDAKKRKTGLSLKEVRERLTL